MSQLRLELMGPLRLWRAGVELDAGPRQQRCLLALLLSRAGQPLGMNDLIGMLWGGEPPASAVNVVHKYVGTLRRLLEPGLPMRSTGTYLLRHGHGYRFVAAPGTLDLLEFRRLAAEARAGAAAGDPGAALDRFVEALGLCRGSAGDCLADSPGSTATFAGIDAEFFDVAVVAAPLATRIGRAAELLPALRLAAEMRPLNEPVHASLVTTLAAAGQRAEALARYRQIRERLVAELGIEPGEELAEAQRQTLTRYAVDPPPPTTGQGLRTRQQPQPPGDRPPGRGYRPVPLVRPAQLPPDQPLFAGRDAELGELRGLTARARDAGRGPATIAVHGMGGVGKSTLVTRFAHEVAAGFADGQLYLDLHVREGDDTSLCPVNALRSLLHGLGVRAADVPDTMDGLVGAYRSLTAGMRVLVLLDNVRDLSQVRALLPNSAESLVLVTSRRPLAGLAALGGASLFHLRPPDLSEARALLRARLAVAGRGFDEHSTLDEIIELCGRLPLALAVLAARLSARPQLSPGAVAAELRDSARRLEAFAERGGIIDPRTAFSWSYTQLSPGAARLFRLLAVAPGPGITVEACVSLSGRDPRDTRADLDELAEAALVSIDAYGGLTSHVLVKAYAEELLRSAEPPGERTAALSRLLQHYLHSASAAETLLEAHRDPIVPPRVLPGVVAERMSDHRDAIRWFARHRDVLKEAVRVAAATGHGIAPWHLAVAMQKYLEWYGFFQDWDDVMRLALRAAREQGDALGEAHMLRCLAGARWFLGANGEALDLLESALALFAENDMVAEQAMVLVNLHAVHTALGRHDLALASSERAVALNRAIGYSRAEVRGLDCNGQSLVRLGRPREAARTLQQALDLSERIQCRHEDASLRVAVAQSLATTGRHGEAIAQLRLAAEAAGESGQGPYRFEAFRALSELLLETGDADGAREVFVHAREVLESFQDGGPDHMRDGLQRLAERLGRRFP